MAKKIEWVKAGKMGGAHKLNGEIILYTDLRKCNIIYVSGLTKLIPGIGIINNLKYCKNYDKDYLYQLLKIFELDCIDLFNDDVNFLSTGELQRFNLIKCILEKPDILILDEAFSGIDEGVGNILLKYIIKELPNSILIYVSHHIKIYDLFNIVININKDKKFEVKNNL
jgi:ABC-type multidrug transport system ATPase subunit